MKIIKVVTLVILLSTVLFSCKKDESEPAPEVHQTIAKDLVDVIAEKGVTEVQISYTTYSNNASSEFSFPGDNFIKVNSLTYNLNLLKYYYISDSYANGKNIRTLKLVFPEP